MSIQDEVLKYLHDIEADWRLTEKRKGAVIAVWG